jgi:hypothetical protein
MAPEANSYLIDDRITEMFHAEFFSQNVDMHETNHHIFSLWHILIGSVCLEI